VLENTDIKQHRPTLSDPPSKVADDVVFSTYALTMPIHSDTLFAVRLAALTTAM
jgi:hypothetical protein